MSGTWSRDINENVSWGIPGWSISRQAGHAVNRRFFKGSLTPREEADVAHVVMAGSGLFGLAATKNVGGALGIAALITGLLWLAGNEG